MTKPAAASEATHPAAGPLAYLPTIDGLRGIAIVLVMWYHGPFLFLLGEQLPQARFWLMSTAGWIGVDLFFVVSGLLITTILLRTRGQARQLPVFWARRALRILPLFYLYLGIVLLLGNGLQVVDRFDGWSWYFLYAGNIHIALNGFQPLTVMLLWSLAVEEQFYLVWPFIVRQLEPRRLLHLCLLIMLLSPLARLLVLEYPAVYVLTFCRADGLAAGAGLAVLLSDASLRAITLRWCRLLAVPALLVVAVVLYVPFGPSFEVTRPRYFTLFGYSYLAVAFAVLTGFTLTAGGWLRAALTNPALTYVGSRCYGFYVWHCLTGIIVARLCSAWAPDAVGFHGKLVLWAVLTGVVASASWVLIERPFLKLKRFVPHGAAAAGTAPALQNLAPAAIGDAAERVGS
jgi:peptidoglycan/LPS O-acetylase OafA/YrhL